jgi:hypothetical protein
MIPEIVFIVPYRDRAPHKKVFECVMPTILEDENYKIFFMHQKDTRPFNRGAMKNIGFTYVKETYPDDYLNITIVFHDIDFLSYYKNQFNYKTQKNIVKHFFGYTWTLGGIVSINAGDFEKINGFPNIWTWGMEDNILQKRCIVEGISIDRSVFYKGGDEEKELITLWHGWNRLIDSTIKKKLTSSSRTDGITILKNIEYNIETISENISMINVTEFITGENHLTATKNASKLNSRYNSHFNDNTKRKKNRFGTFNFKM